MQHMRNTLPKHVCVCVSVSGHSKRNMRQTPAISYFRGAKEQMFPVLPSLWPLTSQLCDSTKLAAAVCTLLRRTQPECPAVPCSDLAGLGGHAPGAGREPDRVSAAVTRCLPQAAASTPTCTYGTSAGRFGAVPLSPALLLRSSSKKRVRVMRRSSGVTNQVSRDPSSSRSAAPAGAQGGPGLEEPAPEAQGSWVSVHTVSHQHHAPSLIQTSCTYGATFMKIRELGDSA